MLRRERTKARKIAENNNVFIKKYAADALQEKTTKIVLITDL